MNPDRYGPEYRPEDDQPKTPKSVLRLIAEILVIVAIGFVLAAAAVNHPFP